MAANKKTFGALGPIDVQKSKSGKVIKVVYDGTEYFTKDDVVKKQKDTHKQLTLLTESFQRGIQEKMMPILQEEARMLRDRLLDLRQVKKAFDENE
jgi:hypothetical protein